MKEKLTGIIAFIGAVGTLFYFGYLLANNWFGSGALKWAIPVSVYTISTILYVIFTRFGKGAADKLTRENHKMKIELENRELKKKLTEDQPAN